MCQSLDGMADGGAKTPFLARIAVAGIVLVLIRGMAHKELSLADCLLRIRPG